MRMPKRLAGLTLTAGVVLAGSLAAAGPASASSSPIEACGGGGYHEIDHKDISGARIHLLFNGTTNCVVTWKTKDVGRRTFVFAAIDAEGRDPVFDQGQFEVFAGPVKIDAAGKCIKWGGGTGPGDHLTDSWSSGPSHCD